MGKKCFLVSSIPNFLIHLVLYGLEYNHIICMILFKMGGNEAITKIVFFQVLIPTVPYIISTIQVYIHLVYMQLFIMFILYNKQVGIHPTFYTTTGHFHQTRNLLFFDGPFGQLNFIFLDRNIIRCILQSLLNNIIYKRNRIC